jgi:hypothetical protein
MGQTQSVSLQVSYLCGQLHPHPAFLVHKSSRSYRHIIEKRLPINVGVLCDFIDYLCGSLIVELRYQRMSVLDNITIPRSWIVRLYRTFAELGNRDPCHFWMLVQPLGELLQQIYAGHGASPVVVLRYWHNKDKIR